MNVQTSPVFLISAAILTFSLTAFGFSSAVNADNSASSNSIHFGILSIAPPARIHANWQPFVDYVSSEMGQAVQIVIPRGFKKMKIAVVKGDVDFFYINSRVFYRLKNRDQAVGVVQMQNLEAKLLVEVKFMYGETVAFKILQN